MNDTREDIGYKRGMPKMKIGSGKIRVRYLVGPGAQEDQVYELQDTPEIRDLIKKGNAVEV